MLFSIFNFSLVIIIALVTITAVKFYVLCKRFKKALYLTHTKHILFSSACKCGNKKVKHSY
jgi:hypothetical protein